MINLLFMQQLLWSGLPLLLETGSHLIYANDTVWGKLQEAERWYSFK
jgi:hypothetical protein